MALPNPDEYIRKITEEAYNQGKQDGIKETLMKMLEYYKDELPEKPCFQFMMGGEDKGCSCACIQCAEDLIDYFVTKSNNER